MRLNHSRPHSHMYRGHTYKAVPCLRIRQNMHPVISPSGSPIPMKTTLERRLPSLASSREKSSACS